jgi:hypothetical protein
LSVGEMKYAKVSTREFASRNGDAGTIRYARLFSL